jgi:tRNA-dihydrouridine synthase A
MVTAAAIVHGDSEYLLSHDTFEYPLALQIGGSDPALIAKACTIASKHDYQEMNLNVGCPSERVQSGAFGACLMAEPDLVADCIKAMQDNTQAEVTLKTRIGIDEQDSYEFLSSLIEKVAATGCRSFTIHARKAWLKGLSPKQNREVPELNYPRVYQLKQDYPELEFVINGGVTSVEEIKQHLQQVDGVMIGRAAYQNPYLLAEAEAELFSETKNLPTRIELIQSYFPYLEQRLSEGTKLTAMTRHILGLFQKCKGAKMWRRHLSEHAHKPGAGIEVVEQALEFVE